MLGSSSLHVNSPLNSLLMGCCYSPGHTSDDHDEEKEDTKMLLDFCNVQKQLIQTHDAIVKLYKDESGSEEEPWNRKSKELVICINQHVDGLNPEVMS